GANDSELRERTNYPRNISRHNYTVEEIRREVERPVVQHLCRLMQFRNLYPVFDGAMEVMDTPANILQIAWRDGELEAVLWADLKSHAFTVTYLDEQGIKAALDLDTDFVWNQ
ncbi:MAG: sucrose phosphorylase, partial [Acetatifactor sp.]|nr:sucrose phosphorylase [Acetatifactor sp.]